MTIKVEREALLKVITSSLSSHSTQPPYSSPSCRPTIRDEFVIVDSVPTIDKGKSDCFYKHITSIPDDDQASLCSLTTASDDSSFEASDIPSIVDRRVSFASQLITDVWTRPRTVSEDISILFYSSQEIQRFRQNYRVERQILGDLSQPEKCTDENEELSNLSSITTAATSLNTSSSIASGSTSLNARRQISRVVVLHDDKLETFFKPADPLFFPNDCRIAEEKNGWQPSSANFQEQLTSCESESEDFFDNDSFWSGSLTWY